MSEHLQETNNTCFNLQSIKEKTSALLEKFNLHNSFPLPIEEVAENLGYVVKIFSPSKEIKNVSGAVSKLKKKILINAEENYLRQRFTLAHEVGHICLHFDDSDQEFVDFRREGVRTLKEDEADEFAAALLMPEEIFIKKWKNYHADFDSLSAYFGVSNAAVGMRAWRLGLA